MNKIVVYTAAFGDNVMVMHQKKFDGVDFICFTDQKRNAKGWQYQYVKYPVPNDPIRNNRYYKLLPHKVLPSQYEVSIYVDGNVIVMNFPYELLDVNLQRTSMLVFDHNQTVKDPRNCIYKEYQALVEMHMKSGKGKDDPQTMEKQVQFFKQRGYPADNGLIKGTILIRKHKDPEVVNVMEKWWHFVSNYSRRDQLSFNFVAWENNFQFEYLPGDIRRNNEWFYMAGKGDKSMLFSIIKYKLRRMLKSLKN